jgi:hypothetical protein
MIIATVVVVKSNLPIKILPWEAEVVLYCAHSAKYLPKGFVVAAPHDCSRLIGHLHGSAEMVGDEVIYLGLRLYLGNRGL